ncbi:hypothetical protein ME1_00592 [Bartonella vinsonii subsp. arupensis OK-94-513]|uniref:Uncharacterized protein n=1 Tax=Bartonella vinsonii subsp. arupensis OK-94-513 TaxID=1094562 RepID=J1JUA4_BARVI|nr:hypothetical protein ME1_00592 [Bartonella vinsonii subsp. arupensis OK-94-513]
MKDFLGKVFQQHTQYLKAFDETTLGAFLKSYTK